jgi:hypothetical protein
MANIAVRLVRDQYPDAELYEGDGTPPNGPTTNVQDVTSWRFVFRLPNNRTALIHSTDWGEFGPVEVVDQPWLEDRVIPWPIEMDITEAAQLLQHGGHTGPFGAVTLRWPLYPGSNQPYYIFGMTDGTYVFVGIYDKSVTPHS